MEKIAKKGYCPLASGSKGNSIYFNSGSTKILIDAGITGKATQERLQQLNVDVADIQAILVTHEHVDHIQGLRVLAFKHGIPVFANAETAKGIVGFFHDCPKFKIFTTGEPFEFGDLEIHPFSIQHDTLDPVGFTIRTGGLKVGLCADLGFVSTLVEHHLQECDYLYVEANHEPDLVHASKRPMIYKQRVLSRTGHLSNEACGRLLNQVHHAGLKHVHLAHLSSECNTHETAMGVVRRVLAEQHKTVDLAIAHQDLVSRFIDF